MSPTTPSRLRKYLLTAPYQPTGQAEALDLASHGSLGFTAEDPAHPVDNILTGSGGPGSPHWSSGRANTTEQLVISFDAPQSLSRLTYEVEETNLQRTQEVRIEISQDSGASYQGVLTQDYTFSPNGATFQHEELQLRAVGVTHLRLTIVPNKQGTGTAVLTSLRLWF
jgi:hypothetical protein